MKIAMLINDTTYAYNLRREILRRFLDEGHEMWVVAEPLLFKKELRDMGCRLVSLKIGRHGTNPFSDLKLALAYHKILKRIAPDAVLTYNIKPSCYGGMACARLGIPCYPNITGLGTPVENPGKLQKLAIFLYREGVKHAECIFFQNEENLEFFRSHDMISAGTRTRLLPGSGVSLDTHPALPYPQEGGPDLSEAAQPAPAEKAAQAEQAVPAEKTAQAVQTTPAEKTAPGAGISAAPAGLSDGKIHFLFVARIMKEKGIDIFLAAARQIMGERSDCAFDICGMCDDEKYVTILEDAQREGIVRYHGQQKDMQPFYRACSCFLYPSYYPEGMSNVLLEAAASARPLIVADRCGCREIVDDGVTGYIVPVNDEQAAIDAARRFLSLTWEQREQMGLAGRQKVEREFDRRLVVEAYLEEVVGGDA